MRRGETRPALPARLLHALAIGGALLICGAATIAKAASEYTGQQLSEPALLPAPWIDTGPVLSAADQDRYRRIFAAQAKGQFTEADRISWDLGDRILMGHVLAQRFLSNTYVSKYGELAQWLEDNGDHANADKIHRLALAKLPKGAKVPAAPPGPVLPEDLRGDAGGMVSERVQRVASGDFQAGVEAWRAGRYEQARKRFEHLATLPGAPAESLAAGALWTARAHLRLGRPEQVNAYLAKAASFPHTFHGLIATRQLGQEIGLRWEVGNDRYPAFDQLLGVAATRRAIALAEVDQREPALAEMRALHRQASPATAALLLDVAARIDAPAEVMKLGEETLLRYATRADVALYPLPRWQPTGGFLVDRALLYSMMRQESGFETGARSPARARGLMQLMPNTAAFVARDPSMGLPVRGKLDEPAVNMELGQRYVLHLLETEAVRGSLVHLLAAYNAGPGNLKAWRDKLKIEDDPLLFIASIPFNETRGFVERVLAGYWIYAHRLGRDLRSLDELAGGQWPLYVDDATASVRERARDYAAD